MQGARRACAHLSELADGGRTCTPVAAVRAFPKQKNNDAPATQTRIRGVRLRREHAHASQPMCILRRTKAKWRRQFSELAPTLKDLETCPSSALFADPGQKRSCRLKPAAGRVIIMDMISQRHRTLHDPRLPSGDECLGCDADRLAAAQRSLGAVNYGETFRSPLEKAPDPRSRFAALALIRVA
jgi:hypothetical protein